MKLVFGAEKFGCSRRIGFYGWEMDGKKHLSWWLNTCPQNGRSEPATLKTIESSFVDAKVYFGFLRFVAKRKGQIQSKFEAQGGTLIHYLYEYVPPKEVVILKLLILKGVSILEAFSRTWYNISNARKLQFCKQPFKNYSRTDCF